MDNQLSTINSENIKIQTNTHKSKLSLKVLGFGALVLITIVFLVMTDSNSAYAEKTSTGVAATSETRTKMRVDDMYLDYNDYIQYVGHISCPMDKDETSRSLGSGYIVNAKGDFVTNYHVVDGMYGDICLVGFTSDYRKAPDEIYLAKLTERYDKDVDYAVLSLIEMVKPIEKDTSTIQFKFMPTCNSDIVRLGDPIVVLGYPGYGGNTITATDGIISGSIGNYFKINARINHGNSGGPVLIDDPQYGCAIGLASYGRSDESGTGDTMNLAIKTENIKL